MIPKFFIWIFGANWKTSVSGIGTAIFGLLTGLAALPYQMGDIALIIPPAYKAKVMVIGGTATLALKIWNSIAQKDRNITGGNTQQTVDGDLAKPGSQTLVDLTAESKPAK